MANAINRVAGKARCPPLWPIVAFAGPTQHPQPGGPPLQKSPSHASNAHHLRDVQRFSVPKRMRDALDSSLTFL